MQETHITVPWRRGLHMTSAARLVHLIQGFRSSVRVLCHGKVADARSIVSLIILGASFQSPLIIEATGDDEHEVVAAVEAFFSEDGDQA